MALILFTFVFLDKVHNDVTTRYYADKLVSVVNDGNEVLVGSALDELLDGCRDPDRRHKVLSDNLADAVLFLSSDTSVVPEDVPEEIALADCSDIVAVTRDYRNGGVAVGLHLFKPLTYGVVVVYVTDFILNLQQIKYIHFKTPFLYHYYNVKLSQRQ